MLSEKGQKRTVKVDVGQRENFQFPVRGKIFEFVRFWSSKNAQSAHGSKPLGHNGLERFIHGLGKSLCAFGF